MCTGHMLHGAASLIVSFIKPNLNMFNSTVLREGEKKITTIRSP